MMKVWAVVLVAALAVVHPSVEAKRMGGGGSMGKQSSNVTQRDAAPRAPQQAPAQQQAAPKPATPAAAPAAPAKKPWGAMLGGLAAGLGLAWLANSLGFGEAFANMLMFGLLALAIMVVVGMVMRARNKPKASSAAASPFAFQGAGAPAPDAVVQPREYNPKNVGNDASARPWEQDHVPAAGGSMIGSGLAAAATNWNVPADFDAASFLEAAKRNFVTLQAAWDRGDVATLRSMMTDEMLSEVKTQLEERETQSSGQANQTDVVM
ncbi:MAG: TIM44-like domain-containing protein, partial [Comamonas sp.]